MNIPIEIGLHEVVDIQIVHSNIPNISGFHQATFNLYRVEFTTSEGKCLVVNCFPKKCQLENNHLKVVEVEDEVYGNK